LDLQNIIPQTVLHKISKLAQGAQEGDCAPAAAKTQEQSAQKPQAQQEYQTAAQQGQTQKTADTTLLSSPQIKEETMKILNKILLAAQGDGTDTAGKAATVVSTEKLAAIAQTAVKNAQNFTKIAQELIVQIEKSNLSPEEKELAKAILREIETVLKRTSPDSPFSQLANALPKNISIDEIFKWTAAQVKTGNLPARDFFAVSQILLGNSAIVQTTNVDVGAGFKPAQMQDQTYVAENHTDADYRAGLKPAPTMTDTQAQNQNIHLFVKQTEANIKANIQNLIPLTQSESIKNLLTEILTTSSQKEKDSATFSFARIEGKIGGETKFLPLVLNTQFNSEFSAVLQKQFPELPKELIANTASIIRISEKPIILSPEVIEDLKSVLKNFTESAPRPVDTAQTANTQTANTPITPILNTPITQSPQITTNAIQTPIELQNTNTPILQNTANITQTPPLILQKATESFGWRITASVLSALLQYIGNPNKNETVLQNFKTLFATEKSVENITTQMR